MKIWDKGLSVNKKIEQFTVGNDRDLDLFLAPWDIIGTMAHIIMLEHVGLINKCELRVLLKELKIIYTDIQSGNFTISPSVEDVHSQVEYQLTDKLKDIGKKIHSARSRNDQVLVDLRLFARDEIKHLLEAVDALFLTLIHKSGEHKNIIIPGYTHLQAAMPSSFGLWFGAYAEGLADDLLLLEAAFRTINQNPLGSAAGYGTSFPVDRELTTKLLGFDGLNYNSVYAQMGRGKTERTLAVAISALAATLSKLAFDICLLTSQNFGFLSLPDDFTTGSSIMPHKKNPDVFEIIRAKCNKLQSLPFEVQCITNNLPSGYFRDYQELKDGLISMFFDIKACLEMANLGVSNIQVNKDVMKDKRYAYIFSVEEVNKLVIRGIPFRDAYRNVADKIKKGSFKPDTQIHHTHAGSIGNLCNDKIEEKYRETRKRINFIKSDKAIESLLNYQVIS